ncbi:MAG: hypothetical protein ACRDA3_09285 [Peptostreptococcaceae bacterium]
MMYIQYIILSIYPLQSIINYIGIGKELAFTQGINRIEVGNDLMYSMFQFMFLAMLFLSVKTEEKKIVEFEDEEKTKKLNKNLIKYKTFVVINIIALTILILLTKDKGLLMPSILLILSSMSIYYAKETYIKSYIYDRKRMWLEKVAESKYDEKDIDTSYWKYKIWNENKIKVPIKDRTFNIIINIIYALLWGGVFVNSELFLATLIFAYFFIRNVLELIENIFSLFTTIDGVCTGVEVTNSYK